MRIGRLDHLVLTVADIGASVAFYTRVLGMEHVEFEDRHAVRFGEQKINLHQTGHEFEPKADRPTPGSADLCFVTSGHLTDVATHLAACDVAIEEGPVGRTGALGSMRSLYVRDPDRNLVEIAIYDGTPAQAGAGERAAMIVANTPRVGHAFKEIIVPLAILTLWDVLVTILYFTYTPNIRPIQLPLPLFGSALALFLSIRDNAAYARWWEARGLWGLMINASRNISREAISFCDVTVPEARPAIVEEITRHQIAYVNVLRTALRGEAMAKETFTYLPKETAEGLKDIANKHNMILTDMGRLASEAHRRGMLNSFSRVRMESTLVDIANAQGGMERIKNTPLPAQYRFFPALFTRIFCVVLPFAIVQDLGIYTPLGSAFVGLMLLILLQIGDDLKNPFSNDEHDVPMTSHCNTIEIDLLQMIGEQAPAKLQPVNGVLW